MRRWIDILSVPEHHMCRAICLAVCLLAGTTGAGAVEGRVIGVFDGDTLLVRSGKSTLRVRLAGIDAPEHEQPFGTRAKAGLAACAAGRTVRVVGSRRDRHGRVVSKVLVGDVDCGLRQIASGLAWHYKRYAREQSAADREAYAGAEETARAERSGLWARPDPVPPWRWRRLHDG